MARIQIQRRNDFISVDTDTGLYYDSDGSLITGTDRPHYGDEDFVVGV